MDPLPPWTHINMTNADWWRSMNMDNRLNAENYLKQLSEGVLSNVLVKLETRQAKHLCSHVLHHMYINIWKRLPLLCFNSISHQSLEEFDEFVNDVLTERGSSMLKTLVYHRCGKESKTNEILLTRMLQYAFDHQVENMWISLKSESGQSTKVNFPVFILQSRTLKLLHLDHCSIQNLNHNIDGKTSSVEGLHILNAATRTLVPLSDMESLHPFSIMSHPFGLTWNNLSSLNFQKIGLRCGQNEIVSPFEEMVNLSSLTISQAFFRSYRPKVFVISAPNLSNLRLSLNKFLYKVRVVGRKLMKMVHLSRVSRIKLVVRYISMEEGLVIRMKESKTTDSEYGLTQVTWSQEEGKDVEMSYDKIQVDDTTKDLLLNAESLPSSLSLSSKCIEGDTQTLAVD